MQEEWRAIEAERVANAVLGPLHPHLIAQVVRERPGEAGGVKLVKPRKEVDAPEQQASKGERQPVARRVGGGRLSAVVVRECIGAGTGREERRHPHEVHVVPDRAGELAKREEVEGRRSERDEREARLKAGHGAESGESANGLGGARDMGRNRHVRDEPGEPLRRDPENRGHRREARGMTYFDGRENHRRNDDPQQRQLKCAPARNEAGHGVSVERGFERWGRNLSPRLRWATRPNGSVSWAEMVPQIDVTKATNRILFVTTTIHISGELLKRLDQRARALGISRNRVILEAIEASLGSNETWPPELKRMLATPIDSDEFEKSHKFEKSPRSVRALRVYRRRAPAL